MDHIEIIYKSYSDHIWVIYGSQSDNRITCITIGYQSDHIRTTIGSHIEDLMLVKLMSGSYVILEQFFQN